MSYSDRLTGPGERGEEKRFVCKAAFSGVASQMPPASTEVREAIDDFERLRRRGAWERALKALYTIPEDQALRLIDGDNGFIITVARKRRLALTALPPEGQAAYRLFYDAEARKLFYDAHAPPQPKNLHPLYPPY